MTSRARLGKFTGEEFVSAIIESIRGSTVKLAQVNVLSCGSEDFARFIAHWLAKFSPGIRVVAIADDTYFQPYRIDGVPRFLYAGPEVKNDQLWGGKHVPVSGCLVDIDCNRLTSEMLGASAGAVGSLAASAEGANADDDDATGNGAQT